MSGTETSIPVAPDAPTKSPVGDNVLASLEGFAFNLVDLVDELKRVRKERDEAVAKASEFETKYTEANNLIGRLHEDRDRDHAEIVNLRKDRDDAQFEALEAREALAKANATLDEFRNFFGTRLGTPAPMVEPTETVDHSASKPTEVHGGETAPTGSSSSVSIPISEGSHYYNTPQAPEVPAHTQDSADTTSDQKPVDNRPWWQREAPLV